jgi:hypothetical protein
LTCTEVNEPALTTSRTGVRYETLAPALETRTTGSGAVEGEESDPECTDDVQAVTVSSSRATIARSGTPGPTRRERETAAADADTTNTMPQVP